MISLDVSPQEDEPSPEAVVHAGELLEVLIRRIGNFALPLITYADIKRVTVADTSGYHLEVKTYAYGLRKRSVC